MRKTLLTLLALAGFAASGAFSGASAAPLVPHHPVAEAAGSPLLPVYYGYDDDWRAREWRRHQREEEWRRHEAWLRWHRWHEEREGYGRW
jgi:hypothetical protein